MISEWQPAMRVQPAPPKDENVGRSFRIRVGEGRSFKVSDRWGGESHGWPECLWMSNIRAELSAEGPFCALSRQYAPSYGA